MQCLGCHLPIRNRQPTASVNGLIEAARRAGASLVVIGLARPENPRASADPRGIDWRLANERRKFTGPRLLSRDPMTTQRGSPKMKRLLERALAER